MKKASTISSLCTNMRRTYGQAVWIMGILWITSPSVFGQYQMEKLDRGVVAVRTGNNNFISWRWLGTEEDNITFNVYRGATKINTTPLTVTSFTDNGAAANSSYTVRAIINNIEQAPSAAVIPWDKVYKSIPLKIPAGGTTPDGVAYTYSASDCSVGDVDGDSQYEFFVKWDPSNSKDNSQSGYTGNVFIDCYKMDGTQLWRIDLGRNIRAGAHYTQFMVYDFDGDGKAEMACKTADATKDGVGTIIGNPNADYRASNGYILTGPEFLTVFNGQTGAAMATANYTPARGTVSSWGDNYGNRVDRFIAVVAYLDGVRPSMVFGRGYYTRLVRSAWDWRGGKLTQRWIFDSNTAGNGAYFAQGNHQMTVGDLDGDGKQEVVNGASAIDDDGKGFFVNGLGHGDALHMSDMDPDRPGLEIWQNQEEPGRYGNCGANAKDARTGAAFYCIGGGNVGDVGRSMAADIDPRYKGYEMWASAGNIYDCKGNTISTGGKPSQCFGVYWDGDLQRELLDGTKLDKWDYINGRMNRIASLYDPAFGSGAACNGTKNTPNISADLFGDWREEIVLHSSDNANLLIYTTTIPTTYKFRTLMHDPQYRVAIAWQNSCYNQPPHLSYYLGSDMATPPKPNITIVGGTTTAGCSLGVTGSISGLSTVCASATGVYSIATVASATGYSWTLPTGAVITSGNSNSVSIRFGNTSGMVQVQPYNACGTSTGTFLFVTVSPISVAGISVATSATTVCSGTGVTLTATGVNTGSAPVYSWFKNNILQATGRTYALVPSQGDQIRASLSIGGNGTACISGSPITSTGIALTVNPVLTPSVSIVSSPTSICSGTGVSFTATGVNGGSAPIYSWYKNNVLQATARTYSFTPSQGDQVTAVLTAGGTLPACLSRTSATSAGIALTVNPMLVTNVTISASSNSVCSGTGVTFTATGTNGGTSPVISWLRNGTSLGSGNTFSYVPSANDQVRAIITPNGIGNACISTVPVTSTGIGITVNPVLVPTVSIVSSATTVCSGTGVFFTASGTNTGSQPIIRWYKNGVAQTLGNTFSLVPANGDLIKAVLNVNGTGIACPSVSTVTSNGISISVNPNSVTGISIAASVTTVCGGQSVSFTATGTNVGAIPTFTWSVDGASVGTGRVFSYVPENADLVRAIVTSSSGCYANSPATSSGLAMTVLSNLTASVSIVASQVSACSGTTVSFSATGVNTGSAPVYLWKVNTSTAGTGTTFAYNPTNSDVVKAILSIGGNGIACTTGSPATAAGIVLNISPAPIWYADTDGDGFGNPLATVAGCTKPTGYVSVAGDLCPTDPNKSLPGNCGCNQTELSCIDCAGTINGTATVDGCGICSGGNTGRQACSGVIQAENACAFDGVTETVNAGFKGASYVNGPNVAGSSISFSILSQGNKTVPMQFRYANGTALSRDAQLVLNGQTLPGVLAFPPTGAFTAWTVSGFSFNLTNGTNVIQVIALAAAGLPNIDQLSFTSTSVGAGSCAKDCQGIIGGTAYLDVCGTCVGGNTGKITLDTDTDGIANCIDPDIDGDNITNALDCDPLNASVGGFQSAAVSIVASQGTLCAGQTAAFTAVGSNAGSNPVYSWSVDGAIVALGKTFSYQPLDGDAVTATVSIGGTGITCVTNATATSSSVSMTVLPVQTASVGIVSSATSICSGAGVSFTASGINAGTAPTFTWRINQQNAGNGIVFSYVPSDGDVVSVVLTVGNSGNGCYTAQTVTSDGITMAVAPNAFPSVTVMSSSIGICAGTSVTLLASSTQTGSLPIYSWYKNGVFQASGATYTLTPVSTDQVVAVVQSGGSLPTCLTAATATSTSISIAVTPIGQSPCLLPDLLSITGPSYVISNANSIVYSVPSTPGVTYLWSIPAGATIVAGDSTNSIVVDFGDNVTGNISVLTTNSVGGVTASIQVTTGVAPDISGINGPETVLPYQTGVIYSITSTAGNNYVWTLPAGATITSGFGTGTITVDFGDNVNGTISVTESNPFGQASGFIAISMAVPTALAKALGEISIQAYPNPFTEGINITVQSIGEKEAKLTLTDLEGHIHENGRIIPLKTVVTLGQNLAAGVYILTVQCGEAVIHEKLVKY